MEVEILILQIGFRRVVLVCRLGATKSLRRAGRRLKSDTEIVVVCEQELPSKAIT